MSALAELSSTRAGRLSLATTTVLIVAVLAGMAQLWPSGEDRGPLADLLAPERYSGEVVSIAKVDCINARFSECRTIAVRLREGPGAGAVTTFKTGESGDVPPLSVGDDVGVLRARALQQGGEANREPYALGPPVRRDALIWFAFGFAGLVALLAGWHGVRSLAGLAISIVVIFAFIVPAILDGGPAVAIALVGGLAVMLATTLFTHGLGPKSLAAILGTTASLAVTAGLAALAISVADLTGSGAESSPLLRFALGEDFSLTGLLLAGIVIASLGVLDDVTVSQASTVMALRRANPALGARELYRGAFEVGRDHVSALVNTLVLAYAGASLPVLLVFGLGAGIGPALDGDAVAEQVAATLVGSAGLVAAMPITTALAALLAVRLNPGELPESAHVHAH